jgi:hypothetical protein
MTSFAVLSTNLVVRIVVVSVPVFVSGSSKHTQITHTPHTHHPPQTHHSPLRPCLSNQQNKQKASNSMQASASQGKYCDEKDEEMVTEM